MKATMTTQHKIISTAVAVTLALLLALSSPVASSQAQPTNRPPEGEESMGSPGNSRPGFREEMLKRRREFRDVRRNERMNHGLGPGSSEGVGGGDGPSGPQGEEGTGFGQRGGPGGGRLMGRYLDVVQSFLTAVQDQHEAVGLAVLGIKESYKRAGKPTQAVKELEEFLKSAKDQKMRNILLFGMRQVYEEERDSDKVVEVNKRIMGENLGGAADSK